jgi:serine/threonine protein kinase
MQYNNEVRVHQYVSKSVNYPGKHYSELLDYWHDMEGVYHRFTVVTKYEDFGDLKHFIDFVRQQKIQLTDTEVIYILNNILKSTLELYKIGVVHREYPPLHAASNPKIYSSTSSSRSSWGISASRLRTRRA